MSDNLPCALKMKPNEAQLKTILKHYYWQCNIRQIRQNDAPNLPILAAKYADQPVLL